MIKVLIILITLLLIVGCCDKNTSEPDYNSSFEINSSHYSNNCFYFDQPELIYETYSVEEIIDSDLPSGWANNAIKLENGQWKLNYEYYPSLPNLSTLKVFIDDGISDNNYSAIEGYEIDVSDSIYHFNECTIGADFNIKNYTLIFRDDLWLDNNKAIGVTYIQNDSLQIGVHDSSSIEVKILKKFNQNNINDPEYWNLQSRNCYKYENIYINNYSYPVIGYKNENDDPLITSIPDSIDLGPHNSIYSFVDYLRLDANLDGRVNSEDTTFGTEYFLFQFPFLYPFKPFEGIELYQEYYEYGNYYIRIEDTYHY